MNQLQQGFRGSKPRAGSDRLQKLPKSLLSALQLISISQIQSHFDPFLITRKFFPIGGRLKTHSDQSEHVLRILILYFCLFQKNEIIFLNFFFRFCN